MATTTHKWKQILFAVAASLGSFTEGMTYAFSSSAIPQLKEQRNTFPVTDNDLALMVGGMMFGTAIGHLLAGVLMNTLGRKRLLLASSLPMIICYILVATAPSSSFLLIGRLLAGLTTAISVCGAIVYNSEISAREIRGAMASLPQIMFSMGNLTEYILGATTKDWRMMTWMGIPVPILFFILMIPAPESPRFLLMKGKDDEAIRAVAFLKGISREAAAEHVEGIKMNIEEMNQPTFQKSMKSFDPIKMKLVILCIFLCILFSLSGGSLLIAIVEPLVDEMGTVIDPKMIALISGITQVISSIIPFILTDKVGRRRLLQASSIGLTVIWSSFGLYAYYIPKGQGSDLSLTGYIPVVLIVLFSVFFSVGYRTVPYVMTTELLPSDIRSFGSGVSFSILGLTLAFLGYAYLYLVKYLHIYGTSWLMASFCFIGFLYPTFLLPETKGKSLEEIEAFMKEKGCCGYKRVSIYEEG